MTNSLKDIPILIKNNKFSEAIECLNNLSKPEKNNTTYFFLKGISHLYLSEFNDAKKNFSEALKLDDKNPNFYFYNAYTLSRTNEYDESIRNLKNAISLKPDSAEFYNNIARSYLSIGENEDAITNFLKSIKLNKNLKEAIDGLLSVLSQTEKINISNSNIILAHNELNKIEIKYNNQEFISDNDIKILLIKTNNILDKYLDKFEFDRVQTYRETQLSPHCNRHLKIFKTKNIIPEYCFGCYKIQVDVKNIIDLIKLYLIFDQFKFTNNNTRKCMIELRPNVQGNYKGLIFCDSISESEIILKELSKVLQKNFNKELNCKIKRGCSEYAVKYPDYNRLDSDAMKYNTDWKNIEENFDKMNPDMTYDKKLRPTINGITLFDALVFRNWLAFARLIGDQNYKIISNKDFYSKFVEEKIQVKKKYS